MLSKVIAQAAAGNQMAMTALIEQFRPLLFSLARKLGGEDARADLTLDFIELIGRINLAAIAQPNDGVLVNYIVASMKNACHKRRKQAYNRITGIPFSLFSDAERHYLEKVAAVCDRYEEGLSDVRGCLSEKEWTVIEMLYVLDYTESHVAQLCQVSRQAVNKTKNRALAKLRERVEHREEDG